MRRHIQHNTEGGGGGGGGEKFPPSMYSPNGILHSVVDWEVFVATVVVARIFIVSYHSFPSFETKVSIFTRTRRDLSTTLFDCFFIFCCISDLTVCNNSFSNHSYLANSGLRISYGACERLKTRNKISFFSEIVSHFNVSIFCPKIKCSYSNRLIRSSSSF